MFVPRRPTALILRPLRHFHFSIRTSDYVGPPDPVSNIRPVLYDDPAITSAESPRHPYALDEFRDDSHALEYQWKLQRQQLDAFNDAFWRDVRPSLTLKPLPPKQVSYINHTVQTNTRFEAAKTAAVSGLLPHATAEQREERLSEFYKNWVLQEATRQEEYNSEWRRRSMQEIKLAARVSYQKLKERFTS